MTFHTPAISGKFRAESVGCCNRWKSTGNLAQIAAHWPKRAVEAAILSKARLAWLGLAWLGSAWLGLRALHRGFVNGVSSQPWVTKQQVEATKPFCPCQKDVLKRRPPNLAPSDQTMRFDHAGASQHAVPLLRRDAAPGDTPPPDCRLKPRGLSAQSLRG